MKKNGILNSSIAKVLADLGHTDKIMLADAGLPIPEGIEKIDLALTLGEPDFLSVLALLEKEMLVEELVLAEEIKDKNKHVEDRIKNLFPNTKTTYVSHEALKEQSKQVKAIIRTGENTPYANVILQADCLF